MPHMIRHGTIVRSTGAAIANAGLCVVNAKYVADIAATDDAANIAIFFFPLIPELHIISFYIYDVPNILYQTIECKIFFNCKLSY